MKFNKTGSLMAAIIWATVALSPLQADERIQSWTLVYESALSDAQRLAVMNQIVEFQDRGFIPLMMDSLDRLFREKIEKGDSTEVKYRKSLAILLTRELGNQMAGEAITLLYGIYSDSKDPFVQSEAAISLGKLRASEYAPRLIRDLADLSLSPPQGSDGRNEEILAYGLVTSLGLMKDIAAYEALFTATISWYSQISKVKSAAQAVLLEMSEDPTEVIAKLVTVLGKYEHKKAALDLELRSSAPVANKNRVARITLQESIRTHETDVMQKTAKVQLALAALDALEEGKDASPETVPLLKEIVLNKFSEDLILAAYRTAGSNTSDESARFLADALFQLNQQQKNGVNGETQRLYIRQIIASMVRQKNALTKEALKQAEFANHDSQVVREVKAALQAY